MRCPFCHNADSRVIDSREADEGATTRRRRSCPKCNRRFTTVEEAVLAVVKRSGVSEPFNRSKVVAGVRRVEEVYRRKRGGRGPHPRDRRAGGDRLMASTLAAEAVGAVRICGNMADLARSAA